MYQIYKEKIDDLLGKKCPRGREGESESEGEGQGRGVANPGVSRCKIENFNDLSKALVRALTIRKQISQGLGDPDLKKKCHLIYNIELVRIRDGDVSSGEDASGNDNHNEA